MAEILTLMAVHAHPDDEASSTGGVLAKYSDEGIRTVVVTCTNGEFGDAPSGIKPGDEGHDEQAVAQIRLAELRESIKHLGVTNLELLGMPDWEYKDRPDAFCNVPVADVAARIGALIEKYRPQVLVTYDDQGLYQHPDHVHASVCAQAAAAATGIPAKVYLTAMRRSDWEQVGEALREQGVEMPEQEALTEEEERRIGESEGRISAVVDIGDVLERKGAALMAHGSQIDDSWFSKIPPDVVAKVFGRESFIRETDTTGAPVPEDDLFAGLRGRDSG
jgi:LmbE family N-acetylglucosaminyl deacetylase